MYNLAFKTKAQGKSSDGQTDKRSHRPDRTHIHCYSVLLVLQNTACTCNISLKMIAITSSLQEKKIKLSRLDSDIL